MESIEALILATAALLASLASDAQTQLAAKTEADHAANRSAPIPLDQLGAVASKQYQGGGLSVTATTEGARLRCVIQQLDGEVTSEDLWLTSTTENANGERFRVVAVALGRQRAGNSLPVASVTRSRL